MSGLQHRLRGLTDRTFVLAFSPRCGSTLVAGDLTRAGLGRPTEYFQPPLYDGSGLSVADYVVETVAAHSVDGLFGCKLSWEQGAALLRRLEADGDVAPGTPLDELFPDVRFLHLTRTDALAQAVSWWRARTTGEWHRPTGSVAPAGGPPQFDLVAATDHFLQVAAEVSLWNEWFRRRGHQPVRINYERWCEDRAGSVVEVAAALGVDLNAPVPVVDELEVMRDDWSELARDMLWAHLCAPSEPDWVGARPRG